MTDQETSKFDAPQPGNIAPVPPGGGPPAPTAVEAAMKAGFSEEEAVEAAAMAGVPDETSPDLGKEEAGQGESALALTNGNPVQGNQGDQNADPDLAPGGEGGEGEGVDASDDDIRTAIGELDSAGAEKTGSGVYSVAAINERLAAAGKNPITAQQRDALPG